MSLVDALSLFLFVCLEILATVGFAAGVVAAVVALLASAWMAGCAIVRAIVECEEIVADHRH